jgi:phenylpropionate dioxygenase-like ring-hydroxylating dioxygenase large terminal subunit
MPTRSAAEFGVVERVLSGAAHCIDPVATAEILPAEAYTNEDFFRFEQRAVMNREWLYLAHVSQVSEPGEVLARQVMGEPVLLVRDTSDDIRVLSAVCQHRGHPLLAGLGAPDTTTAVKLNSMVCPYHAWTYALDGRLTGAPYMRETTPVSQLRETVALPTIRFEIIHGFVFINFSSDAPDLAPSLAKLDELFAQYRAAELLPGAPFVRTGLAFNWKGYFENSLEPYHTDFVHSDTHQAAPARLSGFFDYEEGDGQILTYTRFADGENDLLGASDSGQPVAELPEISGLDDEARSRLLFVAIPPTFFAVVSPTSVLVEAVTPVSAGSTHIVSTIFYPKSTTELPDFGAIHDGEMAGLRSIQLQDEVTQSAVQEALTSRFAPRGIFSWLEATLPQFYSWNLERYRAERHRSWPAGIGGSEESE